MAHFILKNGKAPFGYKLSDEVVKIEINPDGVFANGVSLEKSDGVYSFVYYNSLLPSIQTGNEINYILVLGLMAISLIGFTTGLVILKRKNKKND